MIVMKLRQRKRAGLRRCPDPLLTFPPNGNTLQTIKAGTSLIHAPISREGLWILLTGT